MENSCLWLARQEDLNMKTLTLYGSSKGAEFAMVAATKYDWINSVVAVVPGDAVWAGYGDDDLKEQQKSSWSFEGKPLPFFPLFSFDPNQKGLYRTNTERYSRSRQFARSNF
jgi:dienelactone hydrolase